MTGMLSSPVALASGFALFLMKMRGDTSFSLRTYIASIGGVFHSVVDYVIIQRAKQLIKEYPFKGNKSAKALSTLLKYVYFCFSNFFQSPISKT